VSEAVIIAIVQYAIRYGPDAAKALKEIFATANPTDAQWDALWAKSQTPYSSYVSGTTTRQP
jgi:hypothetical protein